MLDLDAHRGDVELRVAASTRTIIIERQPPSIGPTGAASTEATSTAR
jgi:hypothetical protein